MTSVGRGTMLGASPATEWSEIFMADGAGFESVTVLPEVHVGLRNRWLTGIA